MFPRDYEKSQQFLNEEGRVFIQGRVSAEDDRASKLILSLIHISAKYRICFSKKCINGKNLKLYVKIIFQVSETGEAEGLFFLKEKRGDRTGCFRHSLPDLYEEEI